MSDALSMLGDMLGGVGYALDTPGALLRGIMAGRPGERKSTRDMLEHWGALEPNQDGLDAGDVVGFLGDMVLDPLNLIPGGGLLKLAGKAKAVKAANMASEAMRAAGAMPEELAKLTKIVDESGKPMRMLHGTPHVYDKIDPSKFDPNALYGPGYYTTADGDIASEYMKKGNSQAMRDTVNEHPSVVHKRNRLQKINEALSEAAMASSNSRFNKSRQAHNKLTSVRDKAQSQLDSTIESVFRNTPPTGSVRMQYIDSRNPWNMDDYLDNDSDAIRQLLASKVPSTVPSYSSRDWLKEQQHNMLLEAIRDMGPSVSRGSAWEALDTHWGNPQDAIKNLGYDSIMHTGGQITGGKPHQVVIAFDPSQVYLPYIAPELQKSPALAPLVAALLGYNAVEQPYHAFGER